MKSVLSAQNLDRGVECTQCGEQLTAPAWSGHVSVNEFRNFWHCSKCGFMFETLDVLDADEAAQSPAPAEELLAGLLVA
jgi:transcription elongation factor Elf1